VTRSFNVRSISEEKLGVAVNSAELKRAARVSGGNYYDVATVNRLLHDLVTNSVRLKPGDEIPIWNSHWLAGLFVSLITIEWLLRRRYGMA
jgi:hypothetical protein